MPSCRRRLFSILTIVILTIVALSSLSACRKSPESAASPSPSANAAPGEGASSAPAARERHHGLFISGISPLIVSMSPETIVVHDGHAPMQRFALSYEINGVEKAKKAMITVNDPGVGELQRFDVDVQAKGQIEFLLDASSFDLGPTVRFRAHCPFGDTDWFTMGSVPPEPPLHAPSQQIGNVSPMYANSPRGQTAGAVPVQIWGQQITRDCKPEAQVDSTTVELQNVVAGDKQIRGQLLYSDLQGRPVVTRRFEVDLVVYGPGMPSADIFYLNFAE
jgi:hypothetical protein